MDGIGAEVGQKMRSAIKAKLLELNCYVDDELPDYIMVMVANKRSKSQMNEDLSLFLSTKTSTFVDWLHIVLKKLKEVTVTNPEVYKKVTKRKLTELPDVKVKKERKESRSKRLSTSSDSEQSKSLTDNLPVSANQLSGHRKITILNETKVDNNFEDGFDIPLLSEVNMSSEKDLEEIEKKIKNVKSRLGLLVESDIEEELPEIKSEKEYKSHIMNRRVLLEEGDLIHEEFETDHTQPQENLKDILNSEDSGMKRQERKRITFSPGKEEVPTKKMSILDRLGKRYDSDPARTRISLSEFRKEEEPFLQYSRDKERNRQTERDWRHRKDQRQEREKRDRENRRALSRERRRDGSRDRRRDRSSESRTDVYKEGILSRLGVMSKISMPPREPEEPEPEDELKTREVRSMVQVKPRVVPSGAPQPNTSLLLKAMAEAQKSIAQTPKVGSHHLVELTANKHEETVRERASDEGPTYRKFSQREKTKLKNLILAQAAQRNRHSGGDEGKMEEEYIPKPIRSIRKETPNYVPSSRRMDDDEETTQNGKVRRQFHETVEGLVRSKGEGDLRLSIKSRLDRTAIRPSVKSRLEGRKSPSPIIFDRMQARVNGKSNIPDRLPIVHPPLSIKNKERCKYWPGCRQGDKCEFVHPSINCEAFPRCKWGDKCLYLHPSCKFGSSCTKRDCPYSHLTSKLSTSRLAPGVHSKLASSGLQTCKYFPNCTNVNCTFFHPKLCKFGKYCKNQSDCNFSHVFVSNKSSLTWRSK